MVVFPMNFLVLMESFLMLSLLPSPIWKSGSLQIFQTGAYLATQQNLFRVFGHFVLVKTPELQVIEGHIWTVEKNWENIQQPRRDPLLPGVLGSGPKQRTRTPWTDSAGSQGMLQFGKSVLNPSSRLEMEEERASGNSPSKRGSSLETQPCEWRNNLST